MKRFKIYLLLFSLLILFSGCKGNVPKDEIPSPAPNPTATPQTSDNNGEDTAGRKASDYYMFDKDIHMKYKGSGNEYAEYETYVDYLHNNLMQTRDLNGGTVSVNVIELKDGVLRKKFSQGETYYKYDYTASSNIDNILIKEPIEIGTTWSSANGSNKTITAIDKEVTTPSGTYKALEITTTGQNNIIIDYYVKNIGLVRSEFRFNDSDEIIVSELEKIESGVPYTQSVRLFFPDFENNTLVYIDKNIESMTNEDMKFKFQRELKTIPKDSQLSKVLSQDVEILGITIDDNMGTATIDFSGNLITGMNAGSTLETMVLRSITNTIGTYYQKDKVIITIEGKPYESGHFQMKEGEYFTVDTLGVVEYKGS